ncbi:hypothetical protein [Gemmobacter serpentinus]|uniref:hypothetical protein n=1 Tax=Gemmobacter serpentinus TaxID=2652247 RepID=UPI001CF6CE4A|nr:hypothetical protein [Gemmobacter serpentinus]
MIPRAPLVLAIFLGAAGCAAPDPHLGVGVSPDGVAVTPSVGTNAGPVRLGVSPSGARVSTGLGPLGIGLRL